MAHEPRAGECLERHDFAQIVRLTPLVSIDLVVLSPEGKVLVGKRKHEPAKDVFFVPGGRITKNESLDAAFVRVAQEELGLAAKRQQARFIGVYEHFYAMNRFQEA